MRHIFRIAERYSSVCGPERDAFVADLLEFRESTDGDIELDFTDVRQLNSIALAAVGKMHIWMADKKRSLIISGLNESLDKTFRITGLKRVLNVVDAPSANGFQREVCLK